MRIEEEQKLLQEYGLKNKREIWKAGTKLRNLRRQARLLLARGDKQANVEAEQLVNRLIRYGISSSDIQLGDLLSLSIHDILKRRLQTLVATKGFARSPNQARQLITHGHIWLDGRKVTVPSYAVSVEEEALIKYNEFSAISDESHPIRVQPVQEEQGEEETKEVLEENGGKE